MYTWSIYAQCEKQEPMKSPMSGLYRWLSSGKKFLTRANVTDKNTLTWPSYITLRDKWRSETIFSTPEEALKDAKSWAKDGDRIAIERIIEVHEKTVTQVTSIKKLSLVEVSWEETQ